jgi:hypothetical protein
MKKLCSWSSTGSVGGTELLADQLGKWWALGDDFRTFGASQIPLAIPNFWLSAGI